MKKMRLTLACLLILCLLSLSGAVAESPITIQPSRLPVMQLHQINMGCADAYLVTDGTTVLLVDCGLDTDTPSDTNEPLLTYLAASGIDHVDAHFVTHYHNDHALNLDLLSSLYGTEDTIVYGPSEELPKRFLPLPNGHYEQLKDWQELDIGAFHIRCVSPARPKDRGETNYDSLNFYVTYGQRSIFFTGDWVDYQLFDRHPECAKPVDILSFPHHGLKPFCIQEYELRAMNPEIVLVPSRNAFEVKGFLKYSYCDRFEVYDVTMGNIVILTDGVDMEIHTDVAPGTYASFGSVTMGDVTHINLSGV